MIGRLIERLFVQVQADLSQMSRELQEGVKQTRAATGSMAAQWATVETSIQSLGREFQKGRVTQSQYLKQLNQHVKSMSQVGMEYREAQRQVHGYAGALQSAARAQAVVHNVAPVQRFNRSLGQSRMQMMNLGYQLNDIGMTLATGMNPLTVMIQQGSQILQIYAGQGGVRAALGDVSKMLTGLGKRLWPLALLAGGFKTLQNRINETTDVGVTFGDTLLATFQVLGRHISTVFGPIVSKIAEVFSVVWNTVVDWTIWAMDKLINSVRVAVHVIPAILQSIPRYFESVFSMALAHVYWAMADMTAAVSSAMGGVAQAMNDTFGTTLNTDVLSGATTWLMGAGNDAFVAGDNAGRQAAEGFNQAMSEVGDIWNSSPLGSLFGEIRDQAIVNATNRVADGMEDIAGGAGRAAEETGTLVEELSDGLQEAADNLAGVFGSAFERIAETGRFVFSDFIQDLNQLIITSTSKLLQEELSKMFLTTLRGPSGSGFASLFTGLFSGTSTVGARARGGVEMPWKSFIAGEEGAELISQDGPAGARRVATAGRTRHMMGSGSPGNTVVNINVQTPDADSFKKSQSQIAARMASFINQGARNR